MNDEFRKTFSGGLVVVTRGVSESPYMERVLDAVRRYTFQGIDGNNPYGENDFGALDVEGTKYFFKIDYYDTNLEFHSPDPTDPRVTTRVLTILEAREY